MYSARSRDHITPFKGQDLIGLAKMHTSLSHVSRRADGLESLPLLVSTPAMGGPRETLYSVNFVAYDIIRVDSSSFHSPFYAPVS